MVYHGLMNPPRRRRAILIICDGLGAEWISEARTPTLAGLLANHLRAGDHRAVFPSVTRVSAASIATGCFPGRHGLEGNQMALVEDGRIVVHNVGAPSFRQTMRRVTGRTLRVPTMAERLASVGRPGRLFERLAGRGLFPRSRSFRDGAASRRFLRRRRDAVDRGRSSRRQSRSRRRHRNDPSVLRRRSLPPMASGWPFSGSPTPTSRCTTIRWARRSIFMRSRSRTGWWRRSSRR